MVLWWVMQRKIIIFVFLFFQVGIFCSETTKTKTQLTANSALSQSQSAYQRRERDHPFYTPPRMLPKSLQAEKFKACHFNKYSEIMDIPSDPRDLSMFASGTPYFMLSTVQVLFLAYSLWAFAPVKFVTIRCGMKPKWPIDLVVALVVLGGWCAVTFLMQKTEKIVYNNVLLAVVMAFYSGLMMTFWSWRNVGHGSMQRDDKNISIDTIASALPVNRAFINVDIMRPTSMPIVPALDQGEELGTWHMVHNAVDKLDEYDLLPLPGMLLYASAMPIWSVSCFYLEGNGWRHAEMFIIALFTFINLVLSAPLYCLVRVAKAHAKNESAFPDQILSGWMFLSLFLISVNMLAAISYAIYLFNVSMEWKTSLFMAIVPVFGATISSIVLYLAVLWRIGIKWAVWEFDTRFLMTSLLTLVLFLQ